MRYGVERAVPAGSIPRLLECTHQARIQLRLGRFADLADSQVVPNAGSFGRPQRGDRFTDTRCNRSGRILPDSMLQSPA
jgi:hypothetical protein